MDVTPRQSPIAPGIDLIIGGMYSGKSTELVHRLTVWTQLGFRGLYLNHQLDNRNPYGAPFSTHNPFWGHIHSPVHPANILTPPQQANPAGPTLVPPASPDPNLTLIAAPSISALSAEFYSQFDVIAIDEGQFFPDLVPGTLALVEQLQKFVIIASLNGDSKRQRFGAVLDLIPHCNHCDKLNSYCRRCAEAQPPRITEAIFTYRHPPSFPGLAATPQIQVGGKEQYDPVCRSCYQQLIQQYGGPY